jgi:hypothetical protein
MQRRKDVNELIFSQLADNGKPEGENRPEVGFGGSPIRNDKPWDKASDAGRNPGAMPTYRY